MIVLHLLETVQLSLTFTMQHTMTSSPVPTHEGFPARRNVARNARGNC
jgi:hypothetical protein